MADLNRIVTGEAQAGTPPLLIAHGLFGSARNWNTVAKRLAERRQVVAVDMRNHGQSFWSAETGYAPMAEDLGRVMQDLGPTVDLLGHSMGGKAAMMLALGGQARLGKLIVADIAPVGYGHSHADHVAAMQGVDLSAVERRSDADRQMAAAVPDRAVRAFLLQSLDIGEDGTRWRLNLEALGAGMADLVGWPAVEGRHDGPTLFLRGGRSDYVGPEHAPAIHAQFPGAEIQEIADAGHWLHAEAPDAFVAAVEAFLTPSG
ncbi:MAG: alpha/beta fold hydrolase [Pseudomonadota bacterium]